MTQNSENDRSIQSTLQKEKEEFDDTVPVTPGLSPGGSAAPCSLLVSAKDEEQLALYALAEELLDDPEGLRQFGDRIYDLMQADLRYQRDHFGIFRR